MLDMMLMMIVTGVLAVARHSTSVSKPISAQQHLLTSGARVHLRGFSECHRGIGKDRKSCHYPTQKPGD